MKSIKCVPTSGFGAEFGTGCSSDSCPDVQQAWQALRPSLLVREPSLHAHHLFWADVTCPFFL
eukprot:1157222-Pelagomonas_calceolata.AAC.3